MDLSLSAPVAGVYLITIKWKVFQKIKRLDFSHILLKIFTYFFKMYTIIQLLILICGFLSYFLFNVSDSIKTST